ncbi:MAG: hypothetical protein ACTS40_02125 [Candidatus Hodgkinia cicadicola]
MSSFRPFGGLSASFFEQSSPSDRLIPQNPINFYPPSLYFAVQQLIQRLKWLSNEVQPTADNVLR